MRTATIQLGEDGVLALPRRLREKYGLAEGAPVTVIDLDGVILLSPKVPMVPRLAAEVARLRRRAGLSMADLLAGLPRHRKDREGPRASR